MHSNVEEEFDLTISEVIFPKTSSLHANHFQLSHQTDVLQNLEMRFGVFPLSFSDATQMLKKLSFRNSPKLVMAGQ